MKKISLLMSLVLISALSLFVGCGGGGGGGSIAPVPLISTISGVVSDGPMQNCRVFVDLNNDGAFNAGEPYDITDSSGAYNIQYILENNKEYMVIAEGSTALGTIDPVDNPGGPLDFVMFLTVKTPKNENATKPVGQSYAKNITPKTFQTYLKDLNTELLGGLAATNNVMKNLIEDTSNDASTIFKNHILDTTGGSGKKSTFTSQVKEVNKLIVLEDGNDETVSTKTDAGLDTSNELWFSDSNTTVSTNDLAYVDKTTPNTIGDLVITKKLEEITSNTSYKVFVTPYKTIMDIPKYGQLKTAAHKVMFGADVVIKDQSGVKQIGVSDSNVVTETIAAYNFGTTAVSGLGYFYYDGTSWTEVAGSVAVDAQGNVSGLKNIMKLYPFVLVQKAALPSASTKTVNGYQNLASPVIVAKGHFSGTAHAGGNIFANSAIKSSITLDVGLLSGSTVSFRIPSGFKLDEMVLISKDLTKFTTSKDVSVKIEVDESGEVKNDAPPIVFIEDSELKSLIVSGSGLENNAGLKAYIDTKIPYETLNIPFSTTNSSSDASNALAVLNENINRALLGNTSFYSLSAAQYSWTDTISGNTHAYTVTINNTAKTIQLVETSKNSSNAVIFTNTAIWTFGTAKVDKAVSVLYSAGEKTGTSYRRTITYTKNDGNIVVAVFSNNRSEIYQSQSGYRSQLSGLYEGTAIFNRNASNTLTSLNSAKFKQTHNQTNNASGTNIVDGLVTMQNGKLSFDGTFQVELLSYGTVKGSAVVKESSTYARGYDNGYYNNNKLVEVVLSSDRKYTKTTDTIPSQLIGSWNGVLKDSCSSEDGVILGSILTNTQTWAAESKDKSRQYGTKMVINNKSAIFYHQTNSIFSSATIADDYSKISGNWSYSGCSGSFELTKQ
jgi:hypothetical protein